MHQWHRVEARPGAIGADIGTGSRHNAVSVHALDIGTGWWQLKHVFWHRLKESPGTKTSARFASARDILSSWPFISHISHSLVSLISHSLPLISPTSPTALSLETGSGGAHERRRRGSRPPSPWVRGPPWLREPAARRRRGSAGHHGCGSRPPLPLHGSAPAVGDFFFFSYFF